MAQVLKTYRIRVEDGIVDPYLIEEKEFICFNDNEAKRIFEAYIRENYSNDGKYYYLTDEYDNLILII